MKNKTQNKKILRAVKLKSYCTKEKRNKIKAIIRRYRACVNLFIDYIWLNRAISKLDKQTLQSVQFPDLTERYKSNALKQALQICKSKTTKTKPVFHGFPVLDAKFVEIKPNKTSTKFDLWIRLSTLKRGNRIEIPTKKHAQLNKWLINGDLIQGCELRPDGFIVWVEIDKIENNDIGINKLKIGIDIGMNKLISTSLGDKFGTEFNKINEKILRKQKNSNGYKRAIAEKKNYINQTVNQLPWNCIDLICYENLTNLKKGKKKKSKNLRIKQQYWSYRQVIEAMKTKAETNRVRCVYVNPAYTSQMCSACGCIAASNRNLQDYTCSSCDYTQDADINAARNILAKGLDWITRLESVNKKTCYNSL